MYFPGSHHVHSYRWPNNAFQITKVYFFERNCSVSVSSELLVYLWSISENANWKLNIGDNNWIYLTQNKVNKDGHLEINTVFKVSVQVVFIR